MTRKFTRAAAIAAASMIEIASARTSSQTAGPRPAATRRTRKERTMTRKITIALALVAATVLGIGSASACKRAPGSPLCQVGQEDCEPRCITTSDGGPGRDNQYIDGRRSDGWRWRQTQMRRERFERFRAAQDEGRRHTSDMATGGSRIAGTNITVSPFVPGSTQDRAWQGERKRRGLCGNDRLCNMAD